MAPETRSRGAPPSVDRVYTASPVLQQIQFPARRRVARLNRRHGDRTLAELRQQTLTQLNWASSFDESDGVELDDSDDDIRVMGHEKRDVEEDSDEQPRSSHRRRVKAKENTGGQAKGRRREARLIDNYDDNEAREKTGETSERSRFHTQTMTQFLGRGELPYVDLDLDNNTADPSDGFDAWLGQSAAAHEAEDADDIVPQTPKKSILVEVPSSSQQVTPASVARSGDRLRASSSPEGSPCARRTAKAVEPMPEIVPTVKAASEKTLVLEDDFHTRASVTSVNIATPKNGSRNTADMENSRTKRTSIYSIMKNTQDVAGRRRSIESLDLGETSAKRVRISSRSPQRQPFETHDAVQRPMEIPDSEDDSELSDEEKSTDNESSIDDRFDPGDETQGILDGLATSMVEQPSSLSQLQHLPDMINKHPQMHIGKPPQVTQGTPLQSGKRVRKLLPEPSPESNSTQNWQSQRVPKHIVQGFPTAGWRTDVVLRQSASEVKLITDGYQSIISTPFKLANEVERIWLWDGELLQYALTLDKDAQVVADGQSKWEYPIQQGYQLNDPWDAEQLKSEEVNVTAMKSFLHLPPAISSGMLWNLRRMLFAEDDDTPRPAKKQQLKQDHAHPDKNGHRTASHLNQDQAAHTPLSSKDLTVSQEVEAQLQSDIVHSTQFISDDVLVPSTPNDETPTPKTRTSVLPHQIPSSQATTATQLTTPTKSQAAANMFTQEASYSLPSSQPLLETTNSDNSSIDTPGPQAQPSSSSLNFQDYSVPSPLADFLLGQLCSPSQLLSRSQLLPDSLIGDGSEKAGQNQD